ncbi:MAG: hypothetical protein JOZ49_08425 [Mycolicibacterium sp.]|nr:hypothetical protein [Mycolicibacterium sp.]
MSGPAVTGYDTPLGVSRTWVPLPPAIAEARHRRAVVQALTYLRERR